MLLLCLKLMIHSALDKNHWIYKTGSIKGTNQGTDSNVGI